MDEKARNSIILVGTLGLLGFAVYIIPHIADGIKDLTFTSFIKNVWFLVVGGGIGIYFAVKRFVYNDYDD